MDTIKKIKGSVDKKCLNFYEKQLKKIKKYTQSLCKKELKNQSINKISKFWQKMVKKKTVNQMFNKKT